MPRRVRPSDIEVGVIGYGGAFNMGRGHLQEMAAAGMTPKAVADTDPRRLEAAAKDFPGIETYPSAAEMLRKSAVSLVAIITPHNTHARLALQCLRAGRHVVVEKPFAITTAECDAMIRAARKGRRLLSTYHNRHWDGCILQAVKRIRSGAIGEVVRVEAHMGSWGRPGDWWRSSKSISGGILYDWGVHLLEYTFQIIDADIVEVSGHFKTGFWAPKTKWKSDTNEDEGFLLVRYAGGAWSTLCISHLDSNPKPGQVEVTGTKGSYVFDYRTYQLITHRGPATVVTKGGNPPSQHAKYYQNVADHLSRGRPLVITAEWARRPVHVLDLTCRSAAAGRALPVKYK
ncbi:MAG: dehydrogenase [Phycisphaerae bacterium SM23_33]|nr:MAG: dehydrogenase [Phycisphaerae bacterium SM23_33]